MSEQLKSFRRPLPRISVLIGRLAFPCLILALLVLIGIWTVLNPTLNAFQLAPGRGTNSEALRVIRPELNGINGKGEPYVVTAISAIQKRHDSPIIELDQPKGDLSLNDGSWIILSSDKGFIDRSTNIGTFQDNVSMFHDQGYEIHGDEIIFDMKNGLSHSNKPIAGQGPTGSINAQGFIIKENSSKIFFDGPARLVIYSE